MNGPVFPSLIGHKEVPRAIVKMNSARLLHRGLCFSRSGHIWETPEAMNLARCSEEHAACSYLSKDWSAETKHLRTQRICSVVCPATQPATSTQPASLAGVRGTPRAKSFAMHVLLALTHLESNYWMACSYLFGGGGEEFLLGFLILIFH